MGCGVSWQGKLWPSVRLFPDHAVRLVAAQWREGGGLVFGGIALSGQSYGVVVDRLADCEEMRHGVDKDGGRRCLMRRLGRVFERK